jgi:hypothetical protein
MHFRIAALLLVGLAGCSGNPRDLGITGPGRVQPADVIEPETPEAMPEPTYGRDRYAPSLAPDSNNRRYWGYN